MWRSCLPRRPWKAAYRQLSLALESSPKASSSGVLLLGSVAAATAYTLMGMPTETGATRCQSGAPCNERRAKLAAFRESLCNEYVRKQGKIPEFTLQQVEKQTSATNVLMTYGGFVYNVTKFLPLHPGGTERISRAAGKAIEPFWQLHQQHFDTLEPFELLQGMVVGRLNAEDQARIDAQVQDLQDELDAFRLQVTIPLVKQDQESEQTLYSLGQLQTNFPKTDRISVVGCANSSRGQSTKLFSGVLLKDLLRLPSEKHLGKEEKKDELEIRRIVFSAMDGETVTVTLNNKGDNSSKKNDDWQNILVAYEEDGAPLTQKRGFPIRVIVSPKRVIKWVERIQVQ